ncbi:MAG: hypothetical protein KJ687_06405 [Proteobacteria bacterium]|nr:hypothetical protein [Pseudomonadota bacterium]
MRIALVETMAPESIVVGDNPGLFDYRANEESFAKTGLMEAAGDYYENIGLNGGRAESAD